MRRLAALAIAAALAPACLASPAAAEVHTSAYIAALNFWIVPENVTEAKFTLYGAQGAGGGNGARVTSTLSVTPGEVFTIYVGGAGVNGTGGYNGGGNGYRGGGGATDVRRGGSDLADRILVAGGGGGVGEGGGGCFDTCETGWTFAGGTGGDSGAAGGTGEGSAPAPGGGAGTTSAGGAGGSYGAGSGTGGQLANGGAGGTSSGCGIAFCGGTGGGGGGGLYGGGGGGGGGWAECFCIGGSSFFGQTEGSGGGGGGSSYVAAPLVGTVTEGFRTGDGVLTIEFYVPASATTAAATDIGHDTATMHGTVDPQGDDASTYFEYGTTPAYGNATSEVAAPAAGPFSAGAAGLAPETTYHYRAVVTKCGGCELGTFYGDDMTFTTGPAPPPPPAEPAAAGDAPASGGGSTPEPVAAPTATAPVVDLFTVAPRLFRVAAAPTALRARRTPAGTVFRFRSSAPGSAVIRIQRARRGRRVGTRCVAPRPALARRKRCTRFSRSGSLARRAAAGLNTVRFSGRLGTRALRPGRYRATVVVTAAAGLASAPRSVFFRVAQP